jgi:hypothetical protein
MRQLDRLVPVLARDELEELREASSKISSGGSFGSRLRPTVTMRIPVIAIAAIAPRSAYVPM